MKRILTLSLLAMFVIGLCSIDPETTNSPRTPPQSEESATLKIGETMESPPSPKVSLPLQEMASIRAQVEEISYHFHADPDSGLASALNTEQGFTATFGEDGSLCVEPIDGDWQWKMRTPFSNGILQVSGTEGFSTNGAEFYRNDASGLEHGFILSEKRGADDLLRVEIDIETDLEGRLNENGNIDYFDISGTRQMSYSDLFVVDSAGDRVSARMEFADNCDSIVLVINDLEASYPLIIDPLISTKTGSLEPLNAPTGFGRYMAATENTLVVGAERGNEVVIFDRQGDRWIEAKRIMVSTILEGGITPIAIDGDIIAIGVPFDNDTENLVHEGSVFIFERHAGGDNQWGQTAKITAVNSSSLLRFGTSVSLSGNTLAVVAQGDESLTTAAGVYVFEREISGAWSGRRVLSTPDGSLSTVVIEGDEIIAGYGLENIPGATLLVRDRIAPGGWRLTQQLDDSTASPNFGRALARQGDLMFIGTKSEVIRYEQDPSTRRWSQVGTPISGLFLESFDNVSLSLDGDVFAVASEREGTVTFFERHVGGADQWERTAQIVGQRHIGFGGDLVLLGDQLLVTEKEGSVSSYERRPGGWVSTGEAALPGDAAGSETGEAMAIHGDLLVVGSPGTSLVARGGNDVGAAHVFRRAGVGAEWELIKTLLPDDVFAGDRFGASVSISDTFLAVGAAGGAGKVYLYDRNAGGVDSWGAATPGTLASAAPEPNGAFGTSVAVFGNGRQILVGAPGESGEDGNTYAFQKQNTIPASFTSISLPNSPGTSGEQQGFSMALSGNFLAVGSPNATGKRVQSGSLVDVPGAGAVTVYHFNEVAKTWDMEMRSPFANSFGEFGTEDARYGEQVAIDGRRLLVAAPGVNRAYLYQRCFSPEPWAELTFFETSEGLGGIALSGNRAYLGVPGGSDYPVPSGQIYIYAQSLSGAETWNLEATIPHSGISDDGFAHELAVSGRNLVVGAPGTGSNHGAVHTFRRQARQWRLDRRATGAIGTIASEFGFDLDLDGDILAVGEPSALRSPSDPLPQGKVHLFKRHAGQGDNWAHLKSVSPPQSDGFKLRFGHSVALDGNRLIVGSPMLSTASGAAYLFEQHLGGSNNWGQAKKLVVPTSVNMGSSVAIGGDTILVRDLAQTSADVVYVFINLPSLGWRLEHSFAGIEGYGTSLAIDGDTFAVGIPTLGYGSVELFKRNADDNWASVRTVTAFETGIGSLGQSVALEDDVLVAGAPTYERDGGVETGAAFVYRRDHEGVDRWRLVQLIEPSDWEMGMRFGEVVDIDRGIIAIGASHTGHGALLRGSVSVFEPSAGENRNWQFSTKLDAPRHIGIGFAQAVSLSDDTLAIGDIFAMGDAHLAEIDYSRSALEEWRNGRFGTIAVGNPALESSVWGDFADADRDGLSSLQEAFHGTNPLVREADPIGGLRVDSVSGELVLRWIQNKQSNGVAGHVEWSEDMENWFQSGEAPGGRIPPVIAVHLVEEFSATQYLMEARVDAGGRHRFFMRLKFRVL